MMMKKKFKGISKQIRFGKLPVMVAMTIASLMLLALPAGAADMKASLAKMPVYAETTDKGVLVDLVKAMSKTSGKDIQIQVVPFNKSMHDVVDGKADFHMPLIKPENVDESKLDYANSKETIFHVNFVLYTNKNKPIDKSKLKDSRIETDLAHVDYFDFPIKGSTRIDSSLKKVDAGRIDGFIFADFASDPIIKKEGMKNIHRELYKVFDVKIILPKGDKGKATDAFLTETIQKMRTDGSFDKIMSPIDQPYSDWQP
jgi:polar amino acid transport system substrate-binding protein